MIYGGMSGETVAVTVDGGATWVLSDGVTEPSFGDFCVPHRPPEPLVLLQGCELPLDVAWVGARRVIGYSVQPIAEQMAVLIQRHRR